MNKTSEPQDKEAILMKLAESAKSMPLIPEHGVADTLHVGIEDMPWVVLGNGAEIQLLHVDLAQGLWITRNRMQPGVAVEKHYHTGSVFAVTQKGRWYYKETPDQINSPGSYLFEPPMSVHSLMVPEDQDGPTEVWFAVYGANINLDDNNQVTSIVDANAVLQGYRTYCDALGLGYDKLIVVGENLTDD
jgi:quercetin dioxygenase-like cupin family protein